MMTTEGNGSKPAERWSVRKKAEVVLRLLRGEPVETVSRELEVPVHELEGWRETFVRAGQEGLKARPGDFLERHLKEAQSKIGELTMELELHKKKAQCQEPLRRSAG